MEHTNIEAAKPWLILTAKYAAMNWRRDTAREYLVAEFTEEEERRISKSVEDPEEILIRRLKEKEFTELTGIYLRRYIVKISGGTMRSRSFMCWRNRKRK